MKKQVHEIPFEDIAWKWLTSIGVSVSKDFVTRELQSHPDYPSLTALTDFLETGGMKYYALKSEPQHVSQFNYPLLAHAQADNADYMQQVNTASDWKNDDLLEKKWSGIVLFAEDNPKWQREEHTHIVRRKRALMTLSIAGCILLLTAVAAVFQGSFQPATATWGILSLAGVTISLLTVAKEMGMQIKVVNEVCNSVSAYGCDAVLRSRYAKIGGRVSISDLSLSYFVAQFVFFILSANNATAMLVSQAIAVPLLAVPVASVYSQKFVLKRWCALCLGIVAVLVLQGASSFLLPTGNLLTTPLLMAGYFFLLQAVIYLAILPLKGALKDLRERLAYANELLKWKRDGQLFMHQWEQRPAVDTTTLPGELYLGNREAPLEITVACNPYCGPCSSAHEVLDKIYDLYKDTVGIKVRFTCQPGSKDRITEAVTAILQSAATLPDDDAKAEMIADWFVHRDMEKWQRKWKPTVLTNVDDMILHFSHWSTAAQIVGTPTIFLNGRTLPSKYQLKDLLHLIPALSVSPMALQDQEGIS
ncbi:MAG TPA: vitamin K epoxide reductase family protein [Chitinophaga sp.]|uniref:vitamin K epoxide reductase family protein n=1 Tax=Chitinophaga sp. TaxID=1869181 RepID=UPI002C28FAA2|nr:vitamin K epoxide reductase family protein [Chitinophaga sp.]HVI47845.1 vitamin K epoxide reductase family protein [Chitinophaga sp.]